MTSNEHKTKQRIRKKRAFQTVNDSIRVNSAVGLNITNSNKESRIRKWLNCTQVTWYTSFFQTAKMMPQCRHNVLSDD